MQDDAGTALFLLFKAIKHQVEKGPVDAVTHDARYSLSEERLLREQVEFSPVVSVAPAAPPRPATPPHHIPGAEAGLGCFFCTLISAVFYFFIFFLQLKRVSLLTIFVSLVATNLEKNNSRSVVT